MVYFGFESLKTTRSAQSSRSTLLLALLLVGSSQAQNALSSPKVYRVYGLKADDVLNVRAGPSVSSADIGDLKPDAAPIEVIELDASGKWARFIWSESDGWASTKYLQPIEVPALPGTQVPIGLTCVGSEPSWQLRIDDQERISFQLPGGEPFNWAKLQFAGSSSNGLHFPVAIVAGSGADSITAVLHPRMCSDGMSDRTYGWSADVLSTLKTVTELRSGCCFLR